MNLFFKRSKTKEYNLWHDWYVMLEGKYKLLDNGDSGQLYNHDVSRVIYGSVFKLEGDMPIKDEIIFNEVKQEDDDSQSISASVSKNDELLVIAITYTNASDKDWATSVIESAHRR